MSTEELYDDFYRLLSESRVLEAKKFFVINVAARSGMSMADTEALMAKAAKFAEEQAATEAKMDRIRVLLHDDRQSLPRASIDALSRSAQIVEKLLAARAEAPAPEQPAAEDEVEGEEEEEEQP